MVLVSRVALDMRYVPLFVSKLMSPLIRLGVAKQTREAAANLKKLLESTTA